jgi:molybdopterin-binding protein
MNAKTMIVAGVLALLIAVAAVIATVSESNGKAVAEEKKESPLLIPDLRENINDVARIEMQDSTAKLTLEQKGEGSWVLVEKSSYPVKFSSVRDLVVKLSDLELVEKKTANPELYSRIQVEDVTEEGAQSKLVTLFDKDGKEMGSAILGKANFGQGTRSENGDQFVRKPGEKQSWLAKGNVSLMVNERNWLDTDIVNLENDRVEKVVIEHPEGEKIVASRTDKAVQDFTLETMPEGRDLRSASVTRSLSGLLRSVRFDEVMPKAEAPLEGEPVVAIVDTFNGLRVNSRIYTKDEKDYVVFDAEVLEAKIAEHNAAIPEETAAEGEAPAEGEEPEPKPEPIDLEAIKKEADEINSKYGEWAYVLPAYIADRLQKKNEDFLKELEEPSEEAAAEGSEGSLLPMEALQGTDPLEPLTADEPTS